MDKVRVGILISGAGSNMAGLIEAAEAEDAPFEVAVVISNVPNAGGLAVADAMGVEALSVDHRPFGKDREAHERAIQAELQARGVELVALAGYMRLLTSWLVGQWRERMLNIHPSLLPKYPGLDTHRRAIDAGDDAAGCTIHWVTDGVDEGPIIGQSRVVVLADDTPESLGQRVLAAEHQLYPAVLADICRQIRSS